MNVMNDFDNMLLDMARDNRVPPEVERRVEDTLASLPEVKPAPRSSRAGAHKIRSFALAAAALAAALAVIVAVKGNSSEPAELLPESQVQEQADSTAVLSGVTLLGYNEGEYELSGSGADVVMLRGSGADGVTGCVFGIEGENIQSVSLEISKGSLYRMTRRSATDEELLYLDDVKDQCYYLSSSDENSQGVTLYTCEVLGSSVQESYSADSYYGFYVDSARVSELKASADMQAQAHGAIDEFDGARLTVRALYTDGSESETVYVLHSGRLGVSYLANGAQLINTDGFVSETEPYVYGIIATPEAD